MTLTQATDFGVAVVEITGCNGRPRIAEPDNMQLSDERVVSIGGGEVLWIDQSFEDWIIGEALRSDL